MSVYENKEQKIGLNDIVFVKGWGFCRVLGLLADENLALKPVMPEDNRQFELAAAHAKTVNSKGAKEFIKLYYDRELRKEWDGKSKLKNGMVVRGRMNQVVEVTGFSGPTRVRITERTRKINDKLKSLSFYLDIKDLTPYKQQIHNPLTEGSSPKKPADQELPKQHLSVKKSDPVIEIGDDLAWISRADDSVKGVGTLGYDNNGYEKRQLCVSKMSGAELCILKADDFAIIHHDDFARNLIKKLKQHLPQLSDIEILDLINHIRSPSSE